MLNLQGSPMYWAINSDALFPGDVLLTRNPDSIFADAVCVLTGVPFSHAFICTDPPECVESRGFGVVRFILNRFLIRERTRIKVLRLTNHAARRAEASTAADFAAAQVTREYASIDVLTALTALPILERGKYFCSQLVAEAYANAGVNLTPKQPEKTSPGALLSSTELEDVTDKVVREATPTDRLRADAFLDAPSFRTPHAHEVEIKQKLVDSLRGELKGLRVSATTYDDTLQVLFDKWQNRDSETANLDQILARAIRASGLLQLGSTYWPPDHEHFFLDLDLLHLISWEKPPANDLNTLQRHFTDVLNVRTKTIAEIEVHVNAGRVAFAASALEAVRLNLAILEAHLSVLRRQRAAIEGCLKVVAHAVGTSPPAA